jgi:hypothetical protein
MLHPNVYFLPVHASNVQRLRAVVYKMAYLPAVVAPLLDLVSSSPGRINVHWDRIPWGWGCVGEMRGGSGLFVGGVGWEEREPGQWLLAGGS